MLRRGTYGWRPAALTLATAAGVTVLLSIVFRTLGWEIGLSARDPLAVARAGDDVDQPYVGWVSYLGVVAWGLGAACALLAARVRLARGDRSEAAFLCSLGVLTTLLTLDDLYQLHEYVIPRYLPGPGEVLVLVWGAYAVAWAAAFRRRLLREPELPTLVAAGACLASSLTFDRLDTSGFEETGSQLTGILCWSAFHWRLAVRVSTEP